ncbi:hypothetical protein AAG570_012878 [Ranatra chinensis]|uniref:Uncharacterized protein n=1 Tax=Ranatra chinensis TaxID=642074 RepID=A0ABD0YH21_9HEMI
MYACSVGNSEIVAYLLQQGADPNFHKELFTPLMAVCVSTCENEDDLADCLSGLLDAGAIKDAAERHRITPLMFASMTGRPRLVQGLADRGCRLDLQDCHGWTALFWAVNQGKSDVVQLLLKLGASVDVKDRKGQTPIELAKSKRMHKIEELFGNQGTLSNGLKPVGNAEDGRLVEFRNEANKTRSVFSVELVINHVHEKRFELGIYRRSQVLAMRQVLTQIKNTYEKVSFIRLHLQGHPLNHPLEYSASSLTILQDLSNKSLHQAHILQGELNFLAQHTKQVSWNGQGEPMEVNIADLVEEYLVKRGGVDRDDDSPPRAVEAGSSASDNGSEYGGENDATPR